MPKKGGPGSRKSVRVEEKAALEAEHVGTLLKFARRRQRRSADLCWCLVPSLYPVTLLAYPSGWLVSRGEG